MRVSPENPFDCKFLKVGSVIVLQKMSPTFKNFELPLLFPDRALNIKDVYEESYSWYWQIIVTVCVSKSGHSIKKRILNN